MMLGGVLDIAVVGAGLIGRRHMALIGASRRARLAAIVDPSPASAELAARHGVPHYEDLVQLFTISKPDGAILATPNALHVPGALACALHGVPALIEKPLADSLQEGERLLHELQAHTTPMLVGHHRRHSAALQAAHDVVQRGELGRLVSVMGSALFAKPVSYFVDGPWRKQPGGGPVLINLIHDIDNLRMLCGEITQVQALSSNAIRSFEVEDTVCIILRFANGAMGTFNLSDTAAAPRSWEQTSGENADYPRHDTEDCYFLAGTRGSLAVPTLRTWVYPQEASWWKPFDTQRLAPQSIDPLAAQLAHFCDVIEGRAQPIVTVASALESLRVVQAVQRAMVSGKTETV